MFDKIEIAEQVYEGKSLSKRIIRADAKRDSHVRKRKVVEATLPNNLKKVRAGKGKTKNAVYYSDKTTGAEKNSCCMDPDTPLRS